MELSLVVARSDLSQQCVEMRTRKLPLERARDAFVVALEVQKSLLDRFQAREVVRGERFALDDREVDLDLIEPARVHGQVHNEDERRITNLRRVRLCVQRDEW